jgi:hypothetical protein
MSQCRAKGEIDENLETIFGGGEFLMRRSLPPSIF